MPFKTCGQCGTAVGVRTLKCTCGWSFQQAQVLPPPRPIPAPPVISAPTQVPRTIGGGEYVGPPADKYILETVVSTEELHMFIEDLRTAARASRDTGGTYTAFLCLKDGRKLALQIHL
jgi:hypothetical protein